MSRRSSTRRPTRTSGGGRSSPLANPVTHYRWLLSRRRRRLPWVNALGTTAHEVADADDFGITVGRGGPTGTSARSSTRSSPTASPSSGLSSATPPTGPSARAGTSCRRAAAGRRRASSYGGDLRGIEQHLDHIESLGANVDLPDAVLPGRLDAPLRRDDVRARRPAARRRRRRSRRSRARRTRAASAARRHHAEPHGRRARVVPGGARERRRPSASFYYFDDAIPGGYESWLGHRSLPKLNWRSDGAARRASREVLRRYLELGLDGWRIDVANMVGRYRELDLNHEVAKWTRDAGRRRAARRRARPRLPPRPRRARLARRHELLRLPAPALDVAPARRPDPSSSEQFWGVAGRRAAARRRSSGRGDAPLPRGRALGVDAALVEPARQPRHARASARSPAPRERHLVGVGLQMTTARRADALRGRRARARGRLGRGRTPDDAVGRPRDLGRRLPRRGTRARRAAPLERRARARRDPLRARRRPTRSPTCARRATSGCSCLAARAPHTTPIAPTPFTTRSKRSTARTHRTASLPCRRPRVPRLENR